MHPTAAADARALSNKSSGVPVALMPRYIVVGLGLDTGRKRRRIVQATDEAHARVLSEAEGTSVESIERLPEEPATEAQLVYARNVGIECPTGATKHELSDLLSNYEDRDKPADARHRAFADVYDVSYTQFTGKKSIYRRLFAALSEPGREQELTSWFVYRVYRAMVKDRENDSISGPNHEVIQAIAATLATDDSAIKSIRRYTGTDLIWFGDWTAPDGSVHAGGSVETIAYKRSAALLRERLPADVRKPRSRPSASDAQQAGDLQTAASERTGCASVIVAVALSALLALATVHWVYRLVA